MPRQEAFRQARTERKEPMAEELRIQAIDLTNARRGKQTDQPVTVTGVNSAGIIQVVSGLVCAIEPETQIDLPNIRSE